MADLNLSPFAPGPNDTPEAGLYAGNARELMHDVPDHSIDCIFTDPVYGNTEDYEWLAREAARVLKKNRACLAFASKVRLCECRAAMDEHLSYRTTLYYTVIAKQARPARGQGVIPWTTPCLVYASGVYQCKPFIPDTYVSEKPPLATFGWQKNTGVAIKWIEAHNRHGGVVLDPFCGSGSFLIAAQALGMPFLGFEIDYRRATKARKRIRAQPPLFTLRSAEQVALFREE